VVVLASVPARADEGAAARARRAVATYWQDREPSAALAAARALEADGQPGDAAAYYWIYLNTATLGRDAADGVTARIASLFWREPGPAPATEPPAEAPPPAAALPPRGDARIWPAPVDRRDTARPPAPPAARRWYGWKLMMADAVGLSLIAGGVQDNNAGLAALGGLGLVIAVPVIHRAHPRGGSGFLAVVLRIGGATLGGLAGGSDGAALGYLGAAVVDDALLAKQDAEPPSSPAIAGSLVPAVAMAPGQARLALGGWF